jgi:hypothetical protein
VFVRPAGATEDWTDTESWRAAASIPGVTPMLDDGGEAARAFGSVTSGHVLLYAPDGHLLYSGGITGARGHEGDNEGRQAVLAVIEGFTPQTERHPVFGCGLEDPERAQQLTRHQGEATR